MPVYAYKAIDRQGKQTTGTLPADSKVGAFDQLSARGLSPISVSESGSGAADAGGSRLGRLFGSGGGGGATGAAGAATGAATGLGYAQHTAPPASAKVSAASLEAFTREMANLLSAGLPLSRALA